MSPAMRTSKRIAQPRNATMNRFKMTMALGACPAALACAPALAQDDNITRVGLYSVFYHVRADDVSGPFTPPGLNATVPNINTLYFAYLRRLTSYLQVELTAGLPPQTDIVGKGPNTVGSVPYNGQVLGHVSWLSPSVLLEYVFFDESARWRPYVGVGVNYTHFFDREINANGRAVLGGPTSISQSNSIGPAGTIGISYTPKQHWDVILSLSAARVTSDLTLNTEGIVRHSHADFRPVALVIALGWKF
jgi:outer membrane protein